MRTCPTCGESCAQAWCGFCERMLPLESGCAFGQCTDPTCWMCVGMQQKFKTEPCGGTAEGRPCRLVLGHKGWCKPVSKKKAEELARQEAAKRGGL